MSQEGRRCRRPALIYAGSRDADGRASSGLIDHTGATTRRYARIHVLAARYRVSQRLIASPESSGQDAAYRRFGHHHHFTGRHITLRVMPALPRSRALASFPAHSDGLDCITADFARTPPRFYYWLRRLAGFSRFGGGWLSAISFLMPASLRQPPGSRDVVDFGW